jgi:hypothetical protein
MRLFLIAYKSPAGCREVGYNVCIIFLGASGAVWLAGYVTDPNDFKEKTAVDFSVIFFEKSTAALFPMLMPLSQACHW